MEKQKSTNFTAMLLARLHITTFSQQGSDKHNKIHITCSYLYNRTKKPVHVND